MTKLDLFKKGKVTVYTIVKNEYVNELQIEHIFFRKYYNGKLLITLWTNKYEAENSLEEHFINKDEWKVVIMDWNKLSKLFKNYKYKKNISLNII